MNKLEKFAYDLIKGNPRLKLLIRNTYQNIFDLLPPEKNYFFKEPIIKKGYFFGFHDISPFNMNDDKILSNKLLNSKLKAPSIGEPLEVGYFELDDEVTKFNRIGTTTSWNFHKGARLQWFSNSKIIYNTSNRNRIQSVIYDTLSQTEKLLPFGIDSVSINTNVVSTFSYERLEKFMPGYGYKGCEDFGYIKEKAPEHSFLKVLKPLHDEILLELNLREIASLDQIDDFNKKDLFHYVTHSSFSKSGRFFSILHRAVSPENVQKRISRLIVFDLSSKTHFIPNTSGMVSHYVWNDNDEILAYCNVNDQDGHYLISVFKQSIQPIFPEILNSDGHQSFLNNDIFVTDTYPNKKRMSSIYLGNIRTKEISKIIQIHSPKNFQTTNFYNHIACDLHPRVSFSGKYLSFDGVEDNIRSHFIIKL